MKEILFDQKTSLRYPIIQAPMAGEITDSDFISEVSNFGMLGSLASGYLSLEELENCIIKIKKKTTKPFLVNIFVDYTDYRQLNVPKPAELIQIEKELGIYDSDFFDIPHATKVEEIIDVVIKHNIKAVSTTFGLLHKQDIEKLKNNNIFLITTVNSVKEAKIAIVEQKADAIIFQTIKAGGHKGGFLDDKYSDSLSISKLKEQYPNIVFIKTGEIVDKSDIQETLDQGYDGVQIGTGFLMTKESIILQTYKDALLEVTNEDQTIITDNITGKKARGVRNKLSELKLEKKLPFPALHYATKNIRDFAKKNQLAQYQSLWTGTTAAKIKSIPGLQSYMESLI